MKKVLLSIMLSCVVFSTASCGSSSSNVVDYTGKTESKSESSSGESQNGSSEENQENPTAEESTTESIVEEKESIKNAEETTKVNPGEASYNANIIRFNITNEAYGDGYRYEGIVEIENTGSSNIYLTGTAFDIEDANGGLV